MNVYLSPGFKSSTGKSYSLAETMGVYGRGIMCGETL